MDTRLGLGTSIMMDSDLGLWVLIAALPGSPGPVASMISSLSRALSSFWVLSVLMAVEAIDVDWHGVVLTDRLGDAILVCWCWW